VLINCMNYNIVNKWMVSTKWMVMFRKLIQMIWKKLVQWESVTLSRLHSGMELWTGHYSIYDLFDYNNNIHLYIYIDSIYDSISSTDDTSRWSITTNTIECSLLVFLFLFLFILQLLNLNTRHFLSKFKDITSLIIK